MRKDDYSAMSVNVDGTQWRNTCKRCTLFDVQSLHITTTWQIMIFLFDWQFAAGYTSEDVVDDLHIVDDIQQQENNNFFVTALVPKYNLMLVWLHADRNSMRPITSLKAQCFVGKSIALFSHSASFLWFHDMVGVWLIWSASASQV